MERRQIMELVNPNYFLKKISNEKMEENETFQRDVLFEIEIHFKCLSHGARNWRRQLSQKWRQLIVYWSECKKGEVSRHY